MAKIHLYMSAAPMREGQNVIAKCRDIVDRAQIVCAWDNVPTGTKIDWPVGIGICEKCIKAADKHKGRLLVYAIQSKAETKRA